MHICRNSCTRSFNATIRFVNKHYECYRISYYGHEWCWRYGNRLEVPYTHLAWAGCQIWQIRQLNAFGRACLNHPPIHPIGYGDDQTGDTLHWTGKMDSNLLVTYAHSLEGGPRMPHGAMQASHSGTKWTARDSGRQALQHQEGEVAPGFLGRMRLASLSNSVGWQGAEARYSGISSNCAGPGDKEVCLAGGSYPLEQSRKGNLQLGHSRPSWFYKRPRQHKIWALDFRPHGSLGLGLHLVLCVPSSRRIHPISLEADSPTVVTSASREHYMSSIAGNLGRHQT